MLLLESSGATLSGARACQCQSVLGDARAERPRVCEWDALTCWLVAGGAPLASPDSAWSARGEASEHREEELPAS